MGSQKVRTHRLSESQRLHFIPVKLFLPAHCSAIMVKLSPLLRSFKRSQVLSGNSEQKASLLPCWISLTNWSKLKYSNLKNQTYSTYRTNLWSLKKRRLCFTRLLKKTTMLLLSQRCWQQCAKSVGDGREENNLLHSLQKALSTVSVLSLGEEPQKRYDKLTGCRQIHRFFSILK